VHQRSFSSLLAGLKRINWTSAWVHSRRFDRAPITSNKPTFTRVRQHVSNVPTGLMHRSNKDRYSITSSTARSPEKAHFLGANIQMLFDR